MRQVQQKQTLQGSYPAMWTDAIQELIRGPKTFPHVLARDVIPLTYRGDRLPTTTVERVSGLFLLRLALASATDYPQRLMFFLPNATKDLAQYLAVVLLLGDFAHRFGPQYGFPIPAEEAGPLVKGDVLVLTQHVTDTVQMLREVAVGQVQLADRWKIESFSKYSVPTGEEPRVYVANPGWVRSTLLPQTFGALVVDASHPRTVAHLPTILSGSLRGVVTQAVIAPPLDERHTRELAQSGPLSVWLWDPAAQQGVEAALQGRDHAPTPEPPERVVRLCEDGELDAALETIHGLLSSAVRHGNGPPPRALFESWAIYHRMRQMALPVNEVEEARRRANRVLTLKQRLRSLQDDQEPKGSPYIEVRWGELLDNLHAAYELLQRRREPAKFWALASLISECLASGEEGTIRVVMPTEHEATLLTSLFNDLLDGWTPALQDGRIRVTTVREEPRLIAAGSRERTILLGFRTSESRYLDLYPEMPVDLIAYPYEGVVDAGLQERLYHPAEALQSEECREEILKVLGVERQQAAHTAAMVSPRPRTVYVHTDGGPVPAAPLRLPREAGSLDMDRLLGSNHIGNWTDEIVIPESGGATQEDQRDGFHPSSMVEVVFIEGHRAVYPGWHVVDVYYPATDVLERRMAQEIRPGMIVVSLVDDLYEDLHDRLLEVVRERSDIRTTVALELWQRAKIAALRRCAGSRRELHSQLTRRGIRVDYGAVVTWFRSGEQEILAPLDFEDFRLLAEFSGLYRATEQIRYTFQCVQAERQLRRTSGRILHGLLRRIGTGSHYEAAVQGAKAMGTGVDQVVSAVELREVESVRRGCDSSPGDMNEV